jgi:DNA-binding IclR family transcriptional regulator
MATAVPAVDRAVQILELLREHPFDAMTLSDISRATGIHKATCASILNTMTGHGLLRRDSARRFSIGRRMVAYGHSYTQHFRPFNVGREDIVRLVSETGLSCAAIVRDDDYVVVLDIIGNSQPAHLHMRIGTSVPLEPPVGTIFKAWAPTAELEEWIDLMHAEFGGDRAAYESAVAALRGRGFSLGGEHDVHLELEAALRKARDESDDDRILEVALIVADKIRNYSVAERTDDEPVNSVIAPVFGGDGQVVMTLNLFGDLGTLHHRNLNRYVPPLLATAVKITQRSGGVLPRGFALGTA